MIGSAPGALQLKIASNENHGTLEVDFNCAAPTKVGRAATFEF
jgi:hypothetical protein